MESSKKQYEFLKKMSPQQKLEVAMNLYQSAKKLRSAWIPLKEKEKTVEYDIAEPDRP